MLTLILAFAVCLLGAVLYYVSNGKTSQLGLYAFAVGLLVTLLSVQGTVSVVAHPEPSRSMTRRRR